MELIYDRWVINFTLVSSLPEVGQQKEAWLTQVKLAKKFNSFSLVVKLFQLKYKMFVSLKNIKKVVSIIYD